MGTEPARLHVQTIEPDLTLPGVASYLDATARIAAAFSIAVGSLVLAGWASDVDVLRRLLPGFTAINPATALGFILLAASLAHAFPGSPKWMRTISVALATAVFLLGLSRVGALLGLYDAGADRLLFPEKLGNADFGRPNQMPPNTAVNFVLLGAALAIVDRRIGRIRRPTQLLTLMAAMASLLAVMGYAYGLRWFYGAESPIAMALPTAVTFLVVAIGVLCIRPTHGIMTVIASNSSGGTMIRRLLPAVLLVPAVLGGVRIASERFMRPEGPFSLWLLIVGIMTVFGVMVAWNAQLLFQRDIERVTAEQKLARQATHDPLTRLPNRRLFMLRLRQELDRAEQSGTSVAVLFVDLDLFKVINDSLGHFIGDELLIAAGQRIEKCVDPPAIVGHLSGDEFTVLLPALTGRDRAIEVARHILREFNTSFTVGPHEVFTTVSVGIAFSGESSGPVDLIRHADMAMYQAKARGRARYEIFESSMDAAARERLQLELDLRRALERGELCVYYQPEVEIESGRLVGMEALVRWQHPERGLISPAEFIAVAEETGLIVPIGRWVLREACRQAKEWQTKYRPDLALMVSVNMSGKHLQQASLIDEVRDVLHSTGIDPSYLIIEITETVAMAGAETTIEILTKLKSLGVLLAIDDFGTGFSSLSYLKRFPVDLLKIDKSFVDGVALRGHDTKIVEAIIALGHALGLRVIAEGVETPAQLLELRALGSELGQGFYFGDPLAADDEHGMPHLLVEHRRWNAPEV